MENSDGTHSQDINLSLSMKHHVQEINLDDPDTHKQILVYLLEKVRDNESLIIDLAKTNDSLRRDNALLNEKVSYLQHQTDESISDLENGHEIIKLDIELLKDNIDRLGNSCEDVSANSTADESSLVAVKSFDDDVGDAEVDKLRVANRLKALEEDMKSTKMTASSNHADIKTLEATSKELRSDMSELVKETIRMDTDISTTNQYNRRQNLIIDGIPGNIKQNKLESTCIEIIRNLGFNGSLGPYEIIACHRLKRKDPNSPAPTIIRFFNRKISEFCMKHRSRLNSQSFAWKLNFRDDLNKANEEILAKAESLAKDGLVSKVFTYNGFVKVVKQPNVNNPNPNPIRIAHKSELSMFPHRNMNDSTRTDVSASSHLNDSSG